MNIDREVFSDRSFVTAVPVIDKKLWFRFKYWIQCERWSEAIKASKYRLPSIIDDVLSGGLSSFGREAMPSLHPKRGLKSDIFYALRAQRHEFAYRPNWPRSSRYNNAPGQQQTGRGTSLFFTDSGPDFTIRP